jgi:hypothetical protein
MQRPLDDSATQQHIPEKKLVLSQILNPTAAATGNFAQGGRTASPQSPSPSLSQAGDVHRYVAFDDDDDVPTHTHRSAAAAATNRRRITLPDALDVQSVDGGSDSQLTTHNLASATTAAAASSAGIAVPRGRTGRRSVHQNEQNLRVPPLLPMFDALEISSTASIAAAATSRLARSETAASLAKRREAVSNSPSVLKRQAQSARRPSTVATMKLPSPRRPGDETLQRNPIGQHDESSAHNFSTGSSKGLQRASNNVSQVGRPLQQHHVPSRGSTLTQSILLRSPNRNLALGASSDQLSPSVALLGVGSYQDTKILALRNAELRKELRELKEHNRRHLMEQSAIVASHQRALNRSSGGGYLRSADEYRPDEVNALLSAARRDAESLGDAIAEHSANFEKTQERIQQCLVDARRIRNDITAERMARNSVQCVLRERRQAYEAWKQVIRTERQRQEDARMHELLQRQMASASAGDRVTRSPKEVREERDALFELTKRLDDERERMRSTSKELGHGITEAKRRAAELLHEDDSLDQRMHALKEYISSARRVITERHLEEFPITSSGASGGAADASGQQPQTTTPGAPSGPSHGGAASGRVLRFLAASDAAEPTNVTREIEF